VLLATTNSHVDFAMLSHVSFAREILSRKNELAIKLDSKGSSPLHLVSAKGYLEIVREMLRFNSHVCCIWNKDGGTPLHLATIKGRVDVIKEFIQAKPIVIQTRVYREDTIMHLCVKHNLLEALKLLVQSVNDDEFVNSIDDGNTVLHLTAATKYTELCMD
jgi:ankyrin repeat protein